MFVDISKVSNSRILEKGGFINLQSLSLKRITVTNYFQINKYIHQIVTNSVTLLHVKQYYDLNVLFHLHVDFPCQTWVFLDLGHFEDLKNKIPKTWFLEIIQGCFFLMYFFINGGVIIALILLSGDTARNICIYLLTSQLSNRTQCCIIIKGFSVFSECIADKKE